MKTAANGAGSDGGGAHPSLVVFLGPTVPLAEAQAVLDATYVQPAAQGDVILAAHAFRPRAMVLIDGRFEDRPAVRHKEILWALSQGIIVVGAASMGALRAAELWPFGMIGIGSVYRWYRRWLLAPNDAVAVQSGPSEMGMPPLTDALIDLQATFAALMRRGLITAEQRRSLTAIARGTDFRERTFDGVLAAAGWPSATIAQLRAHRVSRKRDDAIAALKAVPRLLLEMRPPPLSWVATDTFIRDLEASGIDPNLLASYRKL